MSTTDRANVAVTAVLQTVCEALRTDPALRAQLAALLADEIDEAKRQATTEIRLSDE